MSPLGPSLQIPELFQNYHIPFPDIKSTEEDSVNLFHQPHLLCFLNCTTHRCFKALQSTTQPPFGRREHNLSPLQPTQSTKHAIDATPSITLVDFMYLPHLDSKYQAHSRIEQKDLTDSILHEVGHLESWDTQLMSWTSPASFIVRKVWSFVFSLGAYSFVLQGKTIHFSRHHITENAKKLSPSLFKELFLITY